MTKSSKAFKNPEIIIKGARSNNLKSIDLAIPKGNLIVVTGLSGSGKSSLVIDTLYSEGQRRYVESLSSYARQFLHRMKKPDVDYILGLCPAIAIEQKVISTNARSTVGSMTEIYDYLRLLFSKIGKTYSPVSGQEVKKNQVQDIVDFIFQQAEGSEIYLVFKIQSKYAERSLSQEFNFLIQKGFTRILHNGLILDIEDEISKNKELENISVTHQIVNEYKVIADRFILNKDESDFEKRVADSIETVLSESLGTCIVVVNKSKEFPFSTRMELDGITFSEPSPALFNYNNSFGACPKCEGYGRTIGLDENKIVPNPSRSVFEGAIACWWGEKSELWLKPLLKIAHNINFPLHTPYKKLSDEHKEILWEGYKEFKGIRAFFKDLEEKSYKIQNRIMLARFRGRTTCDQCKGCRLRKEALYVKVGNKSIRDLMFIPIDEVLHFIDGLKLSESDQKISSRIIVELKNRLAVLNQIGLSYLHLDRLAVSLSGGESQRIHLTRTLGSNLTSSLYILDEPSIGLHPRDTQNLIRVLIHLRDLGNTVVVIEHEEEIIRSANYIIDIGPGAGLHGGQLEFCGTYKDFLKLKDQNLTASYLTDNYKIKLPPRRRNSIDFLQINNAQVHNLDIISVKIPLHSLVCVSGVSGSGKTTLIKQILYPLLQEKIEDNLSDETELMGAELKGAFKKIKQVELVSQQGIGRSSRSNPATYVKAWDDIREIYSTQPLSKIRGYQAKHFSFNVEGGRCEACKGDGEIVVEMQFLSDVGLICEDCNGKRFRNEILEILYKDKNINDILNLSVEEAFDLFKDKKDIVKKLKPMIDVGLSYLKLGQSTTSLSGGESQRLKLAYYLGLESNQNHVFFIFDEPTTGLHFEDTRKLLISLNALIEKGHSVLVIEHNLEVLKSSDWIIDLGPGGGKDGGKLLYQGVPEGLINIGESLTGQFLNEKLQIIES
ncbi:MAG: excinuclease ABC subunit UvrA [Saprospiraceae bacterium]|nr:excinuclease ABC subunit UvrA [Saprospiraceae bacterium]